MFPVVSFELLQGVDEVLDAVFWDMNACDSGQPSVSRFKAHDYGLIFISGEIKAPVIFGVMNTELVRDLINRSSHGSSLGLLAKLVNSISNG